MSGERDEGMQKMCVKWSLALGVLLVLPRFALDDAQIGTTAHTSGMKVGKKETRKDIPAVELYAFVVYLANLSKTLNRFYLPRHVTLLFLFAAHFVAATVGKTR